MNNEQVVSTHTEARLVGPLLAQVPSLDSITVLGFCGVPEFEAKFGLKPRTFNSPSMGS